MVHFKHAQEIRCHIEPPNGPSIFVKLMMIESSNLSEEDKRKQKQDIEDYLRSFERRDAFNRITYWLPRKLEELYWNVKG